MLSHALASGIASEGVDVFDVGVVPTPGVASLCASRGVPGAIISASHNAFPDNGIKILGPGGTKLSDELEAAVEAELDALVRAHDQTPRPTGAAVGKIIDEPELVHAYVEHLLGTLAPRALEGLRLVVDCAHGAATTVAAEVLAALGATVDVIGDEPTGVNINDGVGSTHPERLAREVCERAADLGLALDGDADRLIAVDHEGSVVNGDVLLALFATDLKSRGRLANDTVVVTVMSNLGFHHAMREAEINVAVVPVGDRHVLQELDARQLTLGGEQSGHIIFRECATTGDGLLTGIFLADLVLRRGKPLKELAAEVLTIVPQTLVAVEVADQSGFAGSEAIAAAIRSAEATLGDEGRVLVRPSGTEPVVRIMVEALDEQQAHVITEQLSAVVIDALGGTLR